MVEEESSDEKLLFKSLQDSGVRLPRNISSVADDHDLSDLVSICAQLLNLITSAAAGDTPPFPASLRPDSSVADHLRICTYIASAIKNLGYLPDISFHQFLYPSEEESSNLIRFLMERLSESLEVGKNGKNGNFSGRSEVKRDEFKSYLEDWIENTDENGVDGNLKKLEAKLNDFRLMREGSESMNPVAKDVKMAFDDELGELNENGLPRASYWKNSTEEVLYGGINETKHEESVSEEIVISLKDQSLKTRYESEETRDREKVLIEEEMANVSSSQDLEEEVELLMAAAEMAFDDQHPIDFYVEQLREKVEAKRHRLEELNSQWEALRNPLEEEKWSLLKALYSNTPEAEETFQKLKEVELETQTVLSDVEKSKDELVELSKELGKQPKVASRKSYIDRVKEITKNSRKQDTDIERILKDTRELQLESNSIHERLHRTYAVVDEMVFREAKKDPVGRQAYRLLTSIHECFEQISEKILATDRIRREVGEREKKLAAMASRSLNVDKLQADLDAITRENEHLEKSLQGKEDH